MDNLAREHEIEPFIDTIICTHDDLYHDQYGIVTCRKCGYNGIELEAKLFGNSYLADCQKAPELCIYCDDLIVGRCGGKPL